MSDDPLSPCPFCGAGVTEIREQTYWTGMRAAPLNTQVYHWCPNGTAVLVIKGSTRVEAIRLWNQRAAVAIP